MKVGDGISHARRMLEIDPLLEDGHGLLMQLLAYAGQREAALNQYQSCVKAFDKELNSAPNAALTVLYQSIQTGMFSIPSTIEVEKIIPRILPVSLTPFIQHKAEFEQICSQGLDSESLHDSHALSE
jgi:hypothetical protein